MRNSAGLIASAFLFACLAFSQTAPAPITGDAVWQMPTDFVSTVHTACDKDSSSKFADCFMQQMSKAGAPTAAVNFTREVVQESGGDIGIMGGFDKVGPVDVAFVKYPLRSANGLLLVNGKPRIVNAEDLKLLDLTNMSNSFQFRDLQNQFPKVELMQGDRNGQTWPNSQAGPNGGVQFVIGYPLRNGCPTCAHAGFALFTWNFNQEGKLLGTTFLGMTPPPVHGPVNPTPQAQ